ncbi:cobyric acid synthase CobQ [Candidatus Magnetoovum chiemensis]|nr:cobyric acid synthase CobQ [Candidatus Magnetoovum chiemensis]
MAKALMIQGTGSGAGKSLISTGLCRIFSRDMGLRVAPFKAQNMALNSYVTKEGGEIGRAQALQAEACGIEPSVYMNPILLKVSGRTGSQVIVLGKVHSTMSAKQYYEFKDEAWKAVVYAYEQLSRRYDLIVIEGAGSPAEINLYTKEIVNMAVARYLDCPVILVGDIDRGGVFASFYGTAALVEDDAKYIKAFLINKFRGDKDILEPGNKMIEEKTKIPVIGVLPYIEDLRLSEEDGLVFNNPYFKSYNNKAHIKIAVLRLKYISNFTDFDPFLYEQDVELVYTLSREDILSADLLIIPGSKNTVKDLLLLRQSGVEESIAEAHRRGIPIIGICGGYQMLSRTIQDPYCVESDEKIVKGFGLLDTETIFDRQKTTCQLTASYNVNSGFELLSGCEFLGLTGYEIHLGQTIGETGVFTIWRQDSRSPISDGASIENVLGTYIHGLFDNNRFRAKLINALLHKKGLTACDSFCVDYSSVKQQSINLLADTIKENIDMDFIINLYRS